MSRIASIVQRYRNLKRWQRWGIHAALLYQLFWVVVLIYPDPWPASHAPKQFHHHVFDQMLLIHMYATAPIALPVRSLGIIDWPTWRPLSFLILIAVYLAEAIYWFFVGGGLCVLVDRIRAGLSKQ